MSFFSNTATVECAYPIIKETIPASNLGYRSNNRYDGFPPIMNDGRSIIASNRSEALLHNSILKQYGTTNHAQYRAYMIKNAKQIMETDFRTASTDAGYPAGERFSDKIVNSDIKTPHLFKTAMDNVTDIRLKYNESDLKDIYLSREQLEARKVAPTLNLTATKTQKIA
jgi:hypothetical protein